MIVLTFMSDKWSRGEIIAAWGLVLAFLAIIAAIITPEIRRCLKLESGVCPWGTEQPQPTPPFSPNPSASKQPQTPPSWKSLSKICEKEWKPQEPRGVQYKFSDDGNSLAYVDQTSINVVDLENCQTKWAIPLENRKALAVALSSNGKLLAFADTANRSISIYDVDKQENLKTITGHKDFVYELSFSHDDKRIASMSKDQTLKIWNSTSGDLIITVNHNHSFDFSDGNLDFSDDDEYLAFSGAFLNLNTGVTFCKSNSKEPEYCRYYYSSIVLDANRNSYIIVRVDDSLKMWNISDAKEVRKFGGWFTGGHWWNSPTANTLSQNRQILATGDSRENYIKLWDFNSAKVTDTLTVENNNNGTIQKLQFISNDQLLVSSHLEGDNKIRFWDMSTKKPIQTLFIDNQYNNFFFSKNGQFLKVINKYYNKDLKVTKYKIIVYKPN